MKSLASFLFLVFLLVACSGLSPETSITDEEAPTAGESSMSEVSAAQPSSPKAPCVVEAKEYFDSQTRLFNQWTEAFRASVGLSPSALENSVVEFQSISRQVSALDAPSCAREADTALNAYMTSTIKAYRLYIQGASESETGAAMDKAQDWLMTYNSEIASLMAEAR